MNKFGVLGFGKMGGAFARGVEDIYGKEKISVYDSYAPSRENAQKCGYNLVNSAKELFDSCGTILVSVKPQDLAAALEGVDANDKLVLSIAAGVTIKRLGKLLCGARIVRIMPNTCAEIKRCCSTVAFSASVTENDKKEAFSILDALGGFVEVEEGEINDYLAVGGSFTAYMYLYLKRFAESAAARGVDYKKALTLAAKTAAGSAEMVLTGEKPIDRLIKDVCSKGGTTIAGLEKLDVPEFGGAINACVNACSDRAEELSEI